MKINIYLPQIYRGIAGGYKVVYQYANYLVKQGHDVCIYYDLKDGENSKKIPKKLSIIIRRLLFINYPNWFKLDENVIQRAVNHYDNKTVRDADVSIATAPKTAYDVYNLNEAKGKKIYFIQGYENWDGTSEEYLHESYKLGLTNIVISKWLKDIVYKITNKEPYLLENGIDLEIFKEIPEISRDDKTIAMIYHDNYNKGCQYGIEALERVKKEIPEVKAILYSGLKKPKRLPNWIDYRQNLNEKEVVEVLNQSSIFMCTSLFEGFGLPGLESMACGCALITTKCQGPEAYANENNSILCDIEDSNALYEAIKELITNEKKKNSILKEGIKTIKNWGIDKKVKEFERIINEVTK